MSENLYDLFHDSFNTKVDFIKQEDKVILDFGDKGMMETYIIFPGIILAYIDIKLHDVNEIFVENDISRRLLEINHCYKGRYAYKVRDDKLIYFSDGDLCVSIYDLTKSISNFPMGYYNGLEIFIDVDMACDSIKKFIPNFDLIEFYEELNKNDGYVLIRANDKIDHVIGELYDVDERIRSSYFKIKTIELLLFFSITHFDESNKKSLSMNQVEIVKNVHHDLMNNLDKTITIDDLASKYSISKTSLKNCFKEVYGKPIFKWRKEYKLDYACKLIKQDSYCISEISRMVGYSSPSKFSNAFKEYVGCTPSEYKQYL